MIAVDTSALMAILLREARQEACKTAIKSDPDLLISAATVAEALIVAAGRNFGSEMARLIDDSGFDIIPVTAASARRAAEAYSRWGRGMHPAALNYGDCFSYVVAKDHACPLLYVGGDFSKTDLRSAL